MLPAENGFLDQLTHLWIRHFFHTVEYLLSDAHHNPLRLIIMDGNPLVFQSTALDQPLQDQVNLFSHALGRLLVRRFYFGSNLLSRLGGRLLARRLYFGSNLLGRLGCRFY